MIFDVIFLIKYSVVVNMSFFFEFNRSFTSASVVAFVVNASNSEVFINCLFCMLVSVNLFFLFVVFVVMFFSVFEEILIFYSKSAFASVGNKKFWSIVVLSLLLFLFLFDVDVVCVVVYCCVWCVCVCNMLWGVDIDFLIFWMCVDVCVLCCCGNVMFVFVDVCIEWLVVYSVCDVVGEVICLVNIVFFISFFLCVCVCEVNYEVKFG